MASGANKTAAASSLLTSQTPRKQRKRDETVEMDEQQLNDVLKETQECQNELDSLTEQCAVEILNIERQYNKQRKPLYEQRAEKIAKVPNFWLRVFASHPATKKLLTKEEMCCLRFLTKIEVEDAEDIESGYWIKFYFSQNPYFENDVLVKDFRFGNADSSSTDIKWKESMNLLLQPGGGGGGDTTRKPATFFDWFVSGSTSDPLQDPIATAIKDDIWHNPLEYCTEYCDAEDEDEEDDDESSMENGDDSGGEGGGERGDDDSDCVVLSDGDN